MVLDINIQNIYLSIENILIFQFYNRTIIHSTKLKCIIIVNIKFVALYDFDCKTETRETTHTGPIKLILIRLN